MVSNTPEYLVDEVYSQYGIEVPLEIVITLLESDPHLTPESLYMYCSQSKENENSVNVVTIPKGFTAIDLANIGDFQIPLTSGNYIWLIKDSCDFPSPNGLIAPCFNRLKVNGECLRVMYTGQAKNLYNRLWRNHLCGKVANSTLRRTLASLMGFEFKQYMSGKTKKLCITPKQEEYITHWLYKNCVVLYKSYVDIDKMEDKLIRTLDPPLNVDKNPNLHNGEFVNQLRSLRKISIISKHSVRKQSFIEKLFVGRAFVGTFFEEDKVIIWICFIIFFLLSYCMISFR